PDELLAKWRQEIERAIRSAFNSRVILAAETLVEATNDKTRELVRRMLDDARAATTAATLLHRMGVLRKELLTKENTLRKRCFPGKEWDADFLSSPIEIFTEAFDSIGKLAEADSGDEIHRQLIEDANTLRAVYHKAEKRYQRRKETLAALDFEDLQLKTL